MQTYQDFITNSCSFPSQEFSLKDGWLQFNDLNMKDVIEQYETPTRLSYLPKINSQIENARTYFEKAIKKHGLGTKYIYTYCTKSSHFDFILKKCLDNGAQIETSSAFDVQIIRHLYNRNWLSKDILLLANGFKRPLYLQNLCEVIEEGFENCIPILDNINEFKTYKERLKQPYKIGIRMASDESPDFNFYTSRLGINKSEILPFYNEQIANDPYASLEVLHFFINTGINDNAYYWTELGKFLNLYCDLRQICPTLTNIDIGGGFPFKDEINFEYDYEQMVDWIVQQVAETCKARNVPPPNIITEFGSYTVAETGAMIYNILDVKKQNDKESWYMIDGSFITNLPDTWALDQKFILLALNHWDKPFTKINLGGLTCDSKDYYNAQRHDTQIYLPEYKQGDEPLYIGLFHTGAYQEALSGYGGVQHCLIPQPQHVVFDHDENNTLKGKIFTHEQKDNEMLEKLGYKPLVL